MSAVCGVLCVLIVALWARSFWWSDFAHCPLPGKSVDLTRITVRLPNGTEFELAPRMFHVSSFQGRFSLYAGKHNPIKSGFFSYGWGMRSTSVKNLVPPRNNNQPRPSWQYSTDRYGQHVLFPHWAPALVFGALAAAFGIRGPYRFSIRTLLVVTTLVAGVLGIVVASR